MENHITVATCESCTGGLLAAAFTDIPGISAVYLEGVVTYTNGAKERLGVKRETLEKFGAVSGETAAEMAQAVRERAGSDIGLSTTGVAGPAASEGKPAGLVFLGFATKDKTGTVKLSLAGSRDDIRKQAVEKVLEHLKFLAETESINE